MSFGRRKIEQRRRSARSRLNIRLPFLASRINYDAHHYYIIGFICSALGGCVYPGEFEESPASFELEPVAELSSPLPSCLKAFGILYGSALNGFSLTSDEQIRWHSYRSGLWFL